MNNLPDRTLKIEVLAVDLVESSCSAECYGDHGHHKEVAGKEKAPDIAASAEQILHCDIPETAECGRILKVSILNVNSALLSEKSPFFCKLFCNGMRESNQKCVSLQIDASEEVAFMDLLNFMESNTLTAATVSALLEVLKAADKFEVPSCIEYCSNHLFDMPMTLESALEFVQLPLSVQFGTLAGIEAFLSSDDLQVSSEDALYDIVMEWAKLHYPTPEERRKILTSTLGHYIRFPYMSFRRLMKILSCNDFDDEFASRVVLEALIFKAEAPCRQRILSEKESISSTSRRFVERPYKYRPIKVVEFDHPYQQCLVYLDLKRQECKTLYPSRRIYSQPFQLGGQLFFLSASCNFDERCTSHSFGLFLGIPSWMKMVFIS